MPVKQLIFTDLPAGEGLVADAAGYQIKACSADLGGADREVLSSICIHHGEGVYHHAPASAMDVETEWRTKATHVDKLPEEVLEAFPLIWSYTRVGEDQYALTCTRYSGLTHDGRFGNFLSHALIFSPDELERLGHNPLAICRLGLPAAELKQGTTLADLPSLKAPAKPTSQKLLLEAPFKENLAALITALGDAETDARPVVLCHQDWRSAPRLGEALLATLPPSARARATVCTHESDRDWRPTGVADARQQPPPHRLMILHNDDPEAFDFRPDEIQSKYAVFDFAGQQISPTKEAGLYATLVTFSLLAGDDKLLKESFKVIEQLGPPWEQPIWDAAVAALLASRPLQLEVPDQAEETGKQLSEASAPEAVEGLPAALEVLAQKGDVDARAGVMGRLGESALHHGRVRAAVCFARAGGDASGRLQSALVKHAVGSQLVDRASGLASADRQQLVELLLDEILRTSKPGKDFPDIVTAAFRAAGETGGLIKAWDQTGEHMLKGYLGGELDSARVALIEALIKQVSAKACPHGNLHLRLKLLTTSSQVDKEYPDMLRGIGAAACRLEGKAEETLKPLLEELEGRHKDPGDYALAVGCLADGASGSKHQERLFKYYGEAEQKIPEGKLPAHMGRLAEAGLGDLLALRALEQILPWKDGSPAELRRWRKLFSKHPPVMDGLCMQTAVRLSRAEKRSDVLPLVTSLLQDMPSQGPGMGLLASQFVLQLKLAPPDHALRAILSRLPDKLKPVAVDRIAVLEMMEGVDREAGKSKWNINHFPVKDAAWPNAARSLLPGEQKVLLDWIVETFRTPGITTPSGASKFLEIADRLMAVSPDAAGQSFCRLARDKDPVTKVLLNTALARALCSDESLPASRLRLFASSVRELDRGSIKLLEDHLKHRFGYRSKKYRARMLRLCAAARISAPEAPPKKKEVAKPTKAEPAKTDGGFLSRFSSGFRRFMGGDEQKGDAAPRKDRPGDPGAPKNVETENKDDAEERRRAKNRKKASNKKKKK